MNPSLRDIPLVKSFLAGAVSGACSTLIFQPLDLVKTRLQSPTDAKLPVVRMTVIFRNVYKADGVTGLWRGLTPSLLRTVPGIGIYFSSLQFITKFYGFSGTATPSPLESLLVGATARSLTSLATIPLSLVKTRYESGFYNYRSISEALTVIYTKHGMRGLFTGLGAMLARDIPFSGLYLMCYNKARQTTSSLMPERQSPWIFFLCGVVAGTVASVLTHPFDVIKTQLQLYPERFTQSRHLVPHIYRTFGIGGLFLGLVPRLLRRTLMAAMSWTIYEEIMIYTRLK